MKETKKLFLVEVVDFRIDSFYVIAIHPSEAYNKVRAFLDENKIGFEKDRELKQITLLAENAKYPDCATRIIC